MQNKLWKILVLVGMICLMGFMPTIAINKNIDAVISDIKLFLNGSRIDKEIVIVDGTSYLPVRAIGEALGLGVNWNEENRTIHLSNIINVQEILKENENLKTRVQDLETQLDAKDETVEISLDVTVYDFEVNVTQETNEMYAVKIDRNKLPQKLQSFTKIGVSMRATEWNKKDIGDYIEKRKREGAFLYNEEKGFRGIGDASKGYLLVILFDYYNNPLGYQVFKQ